MPDNPPTGPAEDAAVGRAAALSPEQIEEVLAEFRDWLRQLPAGTEPPPPIPDGVDLHTLVGQFTALRQEVNLQTRAARAQQEQTAEALRLLDRAIEELRLAPEPADVDEPLRPLLKGLVDVHDALATARRELERVRESVLPGGSLFSQPPEPIPDLPLLPDWKEVDEPPSWWGRLLGRTTRGPGLTAVQRGIIERQALLADWRERLLRQQEERRQAEQTLERVRGFVESVITGYTMSLQRLDRLLEQHGLEAMACVGRPFDPERMEVLEAVANSGRPSGEVLEEVRRGYLWRGRVFRFALVRVARS